MTENENLETDVLIIGSGPAGGGAALALATYGVDHMVITKYRWTANTPRAHITNQRTMEVFRDLGIEAGRLGPGGAARADGRDGLLHQPRRRRDRPRPHLGHAPRPRCRLHDGQPLAELRHPADAARADRRRARGVARQPDPVRHRVRLRSCRTTTASPSPCATGSPATTYDIRAKYVIGADGGRSRGRRGRRAAVRGPDGPRRLDEHRLPRRPVAPGRAPAERPVLGAAARLGRRRHRAGARADGPAVERVADRLGLRHRPAAARRRRRDGHADRPRAGRRRHGRGDDPVDVAVGQQQDVRHPLPHGPGVLHGRRRAPAPAVERAGLQHLDPGRLQPGLEARLRAPRDRGRGAARLLRRGAGADREADRAAGQQEHRGVRPDLLRARRARHGRPGRHAGAHREPPGQHPGGRAAAGGAAHGAGAQGLRVQRARRRARPALRVGRGGTRRHAGARVRPRSRAVLPPDHLARRPAAARLAGPRRSARLDPRPRGQGPVLPAHRHRRARRGPTRPRRSPPTSGSSWPRT